MGKFIRIIGILLGYFLVNCQAAPQFPLSITIDAHKEDEVKQLDSLWQGQLELKKISFIADTVIDQQELSYLTDLRPHKCITSHDVKAAIAHLFKKNCYKKITVIVNKNGASVELYLVLASYTLLRKIKIRGLMVGSDIYKHQYLMNVGDPFDEEKHKRSLERIQALCYQEGYCNATIKSRLKYHEESKQVAVEITINRGSKYTVGTVTIQSGNQSKLPQNLLDSAKQLSQKLPGAYYETALINQETKELKEALAQQGYFDVDIMLEQELDTKKRIINLSFSLLADTQRMMRFHGNTFFSDKELFEALLLFKQSLAVLPGTILADELKQLYYKKGFWQTTVTCQEKDAQCLFTIQEGPRTTIAAIDLITKADIGADDKELLFKQVQKMSFFDQELCAQAIDQLIELLRKRGYLAAKILKQEFIPQEGQAHSWRIIVEEGPRLYLQSVSVEPYKELALQGPILAYNAQKKCMPFDIRIVQEQRQWLLNYFYKQGYATVDVSHAIKQEKGAIALTWHIAVSKEKVTFGKTIITGAHRLPYTSIARELAYQQGQVWDKEKLKKSFLNLKDLELFETIHLYPDQTSKESVEKPIMVHVQEDEPFELRLRAGLELQNFAQTYSWEGLSYRLGGAFIIKNPFNLADLLSFDALYAKDHYEVMGKYRLPWLGSMPIKTVFMGYSTKYDQPGFIGNKKNLYELRQHGFLVGLSRKLERATVGLNVGFEVMKTKIPNQSSDMNSFITRVARAIDFDRALLNQQVPYFQLEPTIMLDFVDQKINPTSGWFTLMSCKGLLPIKKEHRASFVVKALYDQSFFVPLDPVVLALRFRIGHIFFQKFNTIMPSERFYLGGANSLRGYDTDYAPPLGRFINHAGKVQYVPQGGKTMLNLNAEIRFPLYKNLGGVLFQDAGALSCGGVTAIKGQDLLASTGCGLRFATPLGSLRFDIGWKWKKEYPDARSYAWFLTFGQAF